MNALIGVASKHGGTQEIGEAIGDELTRHGVAATVVDIAEVGDSAALGGFAAVILGSAVYMGRLLPHFRRFLDDHTTTLLAIPVWLFSSGPIGAPPRPTTHPPELESYAQELGALGYRSFAGRLDNEELGLKERLIVKAVHAETGDFREWEEIRAWAEAIAARLHEVSLESVG